MNLELNKVYHSDCLELLKQMPDNSIDSIVSDPPYELGFMGKGWDKTGIAYNPELWGEIYRVLKPGGHILAFSGTRTVHRMAVAIEDAGFEIRDQLQWVYNSGFPKNHDVSKAIDKKFGAEREVVGTKKGAGKNPKGYKSDETHHSGAYKPEYDETAPATPEAQKWEGWGTALKPSFEPIVLARKPLGEKTVAENVLKWGTGAINIGGCRIGDEEITTNGKMTNKIYGNYDSENFTGSSREGRYPANTVTLDAHSETIESKYFDVGVANIVPKELQKKASKKDRNSNYLGQEIEGNNHPTVKPIALMEWLIKLVTPYNGIVFDPFTGSGSTLVAAKKLQQTENYKDLKFIGSELTEEYVEITRKRLCD